MNKTALNSQKEKHSMLSLRRATFVGLAAHRLRNISIHALLAESDADNGDAGNGCDAISIHALLAESDYWLPVRHSRTEAFLSTLSLRRATLIRLQQAVNDMKFLSTLSLRRATGGYGCAYLYLIISIHALLAESDGMTEFIGALFDISIHALLAESDLPVFLSGFWAYLFLSTLSLRRATHCIWILCRQHPDFYPRSPCGERRGSSSKSTRCLRISIHALLAESDAWCMSRKTPVQAAFLSTLSLRRATLPETAAVVPSRQFLSTLSLRRATPRTKSTRSRRPYFYPRSPCGERHLHSKRHIRIH